MKKGNVPVKHHFVHENYQKNFSNKKNMIFVLTKEYDFKISEKHPGQICYLPHLHTLEIEKSQFNQIEEFYSRLEGGYANLFKRIDKALELNEKIINDFIETEDGLISLQKLFISIMFWRNPSQQKLAISYSNKLLELFDSADPQALKSFSLERKIIKIIFNKRSNKNFQKIIQFIILPLLTFKIFDKKRGIKITYLDNDDECVTSDNPVVYYGNETELFNFKKFYFAIDNKKLVSYSDTENLDHSIQEINQLIGSNAKKYVIANAENLLSSLKEILKNER